MRCGTTWRARPGFEFIGPWADAEAVKDALMSAGEQSASSTSARSPTPRPAWRAAGSPRRCPPSTPTRTCSTTASGCRCSASRGKRPLNGSFFSEDIEDYYCTPYELGYGRSISFNHDFIGRDALEKAKENVRRTKVTLVFDPEDVRAVVGADQGFLLTYARHRVERGPSWRA